MLKAFLSRAGHRAGGKRGPTTETYYVILDDYIINMPDNLSGTFMPVSQSVDMSALTPSADLYDCNDVVQVLDDGTNMSGDMVQSLYEYKADAIRPSDDLFIAQLLMGKTQHMFAVRTPSTENKFKARQGVKAVKKLARLESASQILTPEEATTYRALSARANDLA